MIFYCHDCQNEFQEDEFYYQRELVGEFMGAPAYQTWAYCPHCRSDNYDEYSREELDRILYGEEGEEDEDITEKRSA